MPAKARQIALFRQEQAKSKALGAKGGRLTLESLKEQIAEGGVKELPIIVKADVQGSAEVLADSLQKLSDDTRQDPHHPLRRRRDQRVRRAARLGEQRDRHRLQRPSRSQCRRRRRAREGGRPPALGHLQRDRGDQEGDDRPARADAQGSRGSGGRPCASCSRCPRSARLPAAWSPTAASRGRATRRPALLRDNVVVYEGKITSLRRFKDDVSRSEVRARMRHRASNASTT